MNIFLYYNNGLKCRTFLWLWNWPMFSSVIWCNPYFHLLPGWAGLVRGNQGPVTPMVLMASVFFGWMDLHHLLILCYKQNLFTFQFCIAMVNPSSRTIVESQCLTMRTLQQKAALQSPVSHVSQRKDAPHTWFCEHVQLRMAAKDAHHWHVELQGS
jgi:hypothetical protein